MQVPFCEDECVQLFRVAFFRIDFFQNPYFSSPYPGFLDLPMALQVGAGAVTAIGY